VTGKEVGYFRLPYEGDDEQSTRGAIEGILRSQRYGYVVTSHDYDSDEQLTATNNYGTVDPNWIIDRTLAWGRVVGQDKVRHGLNDRGHPH
jgi:hypothetical protein